jgi:lysozyme family protein
VRGDELPMGLDYLMFDFAVNAGAGRAIKILQTAVGVTPDGGFGPMTMKAVQAVDPVELIERFSQAKEDFYRSLAQFPTFGKGWLNRVADVKLKASSMLS